MVEQTFDGQDVVVSSPDGEIEYSRLSTFGRFVDPVLSADASALVVEAAVEGGPLNTTRVYQGTGGAFSSPPLAELDGRGPVISADGSTVAFEIAGGQRSMRMFDLATQVEQVIAGPVAGTITEPMQLSGDGQWLLAEQSTGAQTSLVMYSLAPDANFGDSFEVTAGVDSTSPVAWITQNGRFVAYQLAVGLAEVQVLDRDSDEDGVFDESGATSVVTVSLAALPASVPFGDLDDVVVSEDGLLITATASRTDPAPISEFGPLELTTTRVGQVDRSGSVVAVSPNLGETEVAQVLGAGRAIFTISRYTTFLVPVFEVDVDGPSYYETDARIIADSFLWEACPAGSSPLADNLPGDYIIIAGADYDPDEAYGLPIQRFCASNVSADPPYDIVCWSEDRFRQQFIDDLIDGGNRPEGEQIWLAETDLVEALLPAPVKP